MERERLTCSFLSFHPSCVMLSSCVPCRDSFGRLRCEQHQLHALQSVKAKTVNGVAGQDTLGPLGHFRPKPQVIVVTVGGCLSICPCLWQGQLFEVTIYIYRSNRDPPGTPPQLARLSIGDFDSI